MFFENVFCGRRAWKRLYEMLLRMPLRKTLKKKCLCENAFNIINLEILLIENALLGT
jgi:hypothetical protein